MEMTSVSPEMEIIVDLLNKDTNKKNSTRNINKPYAKKLSNTLQ